MAFVEVLILLVFALGVMATGIVAIVVIASSKRRGQGQPPMQQGWGPAPPYGTPQPPPGGGPHPGAGPNPGGGFPPPPTG
jgi:hypothetical protein